MSWRARCGLLAVVAVIGLGVLWITRAATMGLPNTTADSLSSPATQHDASDSSAATAESAPAAFAASKTEPGAGASSVTRAAVGATNEPDATNAIWVEGVVVLPRDTPVDEKVEVVAEGHFKCNRAPLGPDGRFRIAFPRGGKTGVLRLAARHVYLDPNPKIVLAAPPNEFVLHAKLGGRIHGSLVLSSESLDPASLATTPVELYGVLPSEEFDAEDSIARTTRVDARLQFEIPALPSDRLYALTSKPKGLMPVERRGVKVEAGKTTEVELQVLRGVHISGRVVDDFGRPVVKALITASVKDGGAPTSYLAATSTVDGSFDAPGVRPGAITLTVNRSGYLPSNMDLGVSADGERKRGVELVLPRGNSISGRVEWSDGMPARGCTVICAWHDKTDATPTGRSSSRTATGRTESDGTFVITGVGIEEVHLFVKERRTIEDRGVSGSKGTSRTRGATFTASAEHIQPGTEGVRLVLHPTLELRGRVVDDAGEPLKRFRIEAEPITDQDSPERPDALHRTFNSPDGTFVFDGLDAGEWTFRADAKGYAWSSPQRLLVPHHEDPIQLVVPRAARISGTVVDPAGKGVAGASVRQWSSARFGDRTRVESGVETDEVGRFEFDDAEPGASQLTASCPRYANSEFVEVELAAGELRSGVVLRLRAGGRAVGDVFDAAGAPCANCLVTVSGETIYREVTTDGSGRFDVDHLSAGSYTFQYRPTDPSATVLRTRAEVREGETTRVALERRRTAR